MIAVIPQEPASVVSLVPALIAEQATLAGGLLVDGTGFVDDVEVIAGRFHLVQVHDLEVAVFVAEDAAVTLRFESHLDSVFRRPARFRGEAVRIAEQDADFGATGRARTTVAAAAVAAAEQAVLAIDFLRHRSGGFVGPAGHSRDGGADVAVAVADVAIQASVDHSHNSFSISPVGAVMTR